MKQKHEKNDQTTNQHEARGSDIAKAPTTAAGFPLGRVVITANAERELVRDDVAAALNRHAAGDWGECGAEDWAENDLSMREGFRLFSVYRDRLGAKFWIITEADRSVTTILLPSDY